MVEGRSIAATLIQLGNQQEGVVFATRADVTGGLLGARFPGGQGLGPDDLGACRVSPAAGTNAAGAQDRESYVVALSPYPTAVEHAREDEGWSAW